MFVIRGYGLPFGYTIANLNGGWTGTTI